MAFNFNWKNFISRQLSVPVVRATDSKPDLTAAATAAAAPIEEPECPLDREGLGRNTWGFLHTLAATIPEKPTRKEQKEVSQFINFLGKYYPCSMCAEELRNSLKTSPPDVRTRHDFSQWMCRLHNGVNERQGKPTFDCSKIDERWKDGWKDGHCD